MTKEKEYKFNLEHKLSDDECEVIEKFLSYYLKQNIIVADYYSRKYDRIPLYNDNVVFTAFDNESLSIDFSRKINYKRKTYIVNLSLLRSRYSNLLKIHDFRITLGDEIHIIPLDKGDAVNKGLLAAILSIFNENIIISPEQVYASRMYNNSKLQKFINNHEWYNIRYGLEESPGLANALFIIREGYELTYNYTADFGTILYQLISFRMNNLNDFNEKDLRYLDELIFSLRKTQLLKVRLDETIYSTLSGPSSFLLLEDNKQSSRNHISRQYTPENAELLSEQKILNKCVKNFKKNN